MKILQVTLMLLAIGFCSHQALGNENGLIHEIRIAVVNSCKTEFTERGDTWIPEGNSYSALVLRKPLGFFSEIDVVGSQTPDVLDFKRSLAGDSRTHISVLWEPDVSRMAIFWNRDAPRSFTGFAQFENSQFRGNIAFRGDAENDRITIREFLVNSRMVLTLNDSEKWELKKMSASRAWPQNPFHGADENNASESMKPSKNITE